MRRALIHILFLLVPMFSFAQEGVTIKKDVGGATFVDDSLSLLAKQLEQKFQLNKATQEGFKLQKDAGLDMENMKFQLEPKRITGNAMQFDKYVDSIQYNNPELNLSRQYYYPANSEFIWQRSMFANDFKQSGKIVNWDGGYVTGYSSLETMPILGSVRMGGASVTQHFGSHWTVEGGLSLQKYNMPHNAYNTYGANATVSYLLNRNVGFSVFGNYESSPFFSNYRNGSFLNYGGFMTLKTNNDKWGMDMGAQAYRDPYSGRTTAVPIIRPFYNMNGQKLGFDFGGLLYQIFQNLNYKSSGGGDWSDRPANMRPVGVPSGGGMGGRAMGFEQQRGVRGGMHP